MLSCGNNKHGQLGNGNFGTYSTILQRAILNGKAKQIACGRDYIIVLMEDGKVFSCGCNFFGQLGYDRNVSTWLPNNNFQRVSLNGKAKQISCQSWVTFILMENGTVLRCGANADGQLLNRYNTYPSFLRKINLADKVKQISCGMEHTVLLMENDIMVSCGLNEHGELGRKLGLFRACDSTFKKCYFFRDSLKKTLL